MAKQLQNKHPLAIRWLHWINFPILSMMIWSGLLIYWANAVYGLKILGYELFHFFPRGSGITSAFRFAWPRACSFISSLCGCLR